MVVADVTAYTALDPANPLTEFIWSEHQTTTSCHGTWASYQLLHNRLKRNHTCKRIFKQGRGPRYLTASPPLSYCPQRYRRRSSTESTGSVVLQYCKILFFWLHGQSTCVQLKFKNFFDKISLYIQKVIVSIIFATTYL